MNPSRPNPRRPLTPNLAPELLESREMMTGGVGNTFAIMPATIAKANGQVSVSFSLNPSLFSTRAHKPFLLGLDVAPNTNSTVNPVIRSVTTPTGQVLKVSHAAFDPKVTRTGPQSASGIASGGIVTIPNLPTKNAKSFVYKVNVSALDKTSGNILVGFYLPGDADGNGVVNQADLNSIRYSLNTTASDTTGKYSFDTDANRDGRITAKDLAIAEQNMGASTTVSPVISADLDPASVTDSKNRISNKPTVHVTGTATPNATISYALTNTPATVAVADAAGKYSILLPLALGANTFHVTTTDAFNQTIVGSINSITYDPKATPVIASAVSSTPPKTI